MKKKKKYIYIYIYCKGKYSRGEIFLRGNIPAGKYSRGFGDFFSNSRVFPHKNISLPQRIFAKVIKNVRNHQVQAGKKNYFLANTSKTTMLHNENNFCCNFPL